MPLGTKLWTSQEGPAHVPPLRVVTLPRTPPPPPPGEPSALLSTWRNRPGSTLPCVHGDSLLASPHYPLPPVAREPEPFSPRPSPPCVDNGHLEGMGPGDGLAIVCSWSQPQLHFLFKNGNLGHRQLKGDPGPQSEVWPTRLQARALLGIPNLTAHSRSPEIMQAHFLWEAGGCRGAGSSPGRGLGGGLGTVAWEWGGLGVGDLEPCMVWESGLLWRWPVLAGRQWEAACA